MDQPTDGIVDNVYNLETGVITVIGQENPLHMATQVKTDFTGKVTPLRQWSDMTWLQWDHLAGENVDRLSRVVIQGASNAETLRVLRWVFEDDNTRQMPNWDKAKQVHMTTDQGMAILATPSGAGVAKLLYDHRNDFGDDKTISKVTIWDELTTDDMRADFTRISPNLMFSIVNHRLRAG